MEADDGAEREGAAGSFIKCAARNPNVSMGEGGCEVGLLPSHGFLSVDSVEQGWHGYVSGVMQAVLHALIEIITALPSLGLTRT